MTTLQEFYLLTTFLLSYGGLTATDLRRAGPNSGAPFAFMAVTAIATLAAMAMFVWGFFLVQWWMPFLPAIASAVVWVFFTPNSVRYGRWLVPVGIVCSSLGFLNLALHFVAR